jgi:putative endonuclease
MKDKLYYLYIMASPGGTLYVGMTSNLINRVTQHKNGEIEGFTKKYGCKKLVYYEISTDVSAVIAREKEIKNWRRAKKEELIKKFNLHWKDLSADLFK